MHYGAKIPICIFYVYAWYVDVRSKLGKAWALPWALTGQGRARQATRAAGAVLSVFLFLTRFVLQPKRRRRSRISPPENLGHDPWALETCQRGSNFKRVALLQPQPYLFNELRLSSASRPMQHERSYHDHLSTLSAASAFSDGTSPYPESSTPRTRDQA